MTKMNAMLLLLVANPIAAVTLDERIAKLEARVADNKHKVQGKNMIDNSEWEKLNQWCECKECTDDTVSTGRDFCWARGVGCYNCYSDQVDPYYACKCHENKLKKSGSMYCNSDDECVTNECVTEGEWPDWYCR